MEQAAEMVNTDASHIIGKREEDFIGKERTDFLVEAEREVIETANRNRSSNALPTETVRLKFCLSTKH